MTLTRRNVLKLSGILIVALALVLPSLPMAQQSGKVELLWLGQAAFKITSPGGKVIVTDPFIKLEF